MARSTLAQFVIALLLVPAMSGAASQPTLKSVERYLAKTHINTCLAGSLVDDENANGVAMRTELRGRAEADDMRSRAILPMHDIKGAQSAEGAYTVAYDAAHGLFAVVLSAMRPTRSWSRRWRRRQASPS